MVTTDGSDDLIRSAVVRTNKEIYKRPEVKLTLVLQNKKECVRWKISKRCEIWASQIGKSSKGQLKQLSWNKTTSKI